MLRSPYSCKPLGPLGEMWLEFWSTNFAYIILRVGLDIKTWRWGFPRGRKAVQALCHVFDLMESLDE